MPETTTVQVLRPDDDRFDAARQAFNLMVDQRGYTRLEAVKAEYDPDNGITGSHAITAG